MKAKIREREIHLPLQRMKNERHTTKDGGEERKGEEEKLMKEKTPMEDRNSRNLKQ